MSSSSLLHKRPDISYRSIGTFFSFIQFLTVNTFVNSYRKSKVSFPQQLHSYFNLDHQTRFIMAPLGNFLSVKRYTLHRFMQFRLSVYMCVCVCVCVCVPPPLVHSWLSFRENNEPPLSSSSPISPSFTTTTTTTTTTHTCTYKTLAFFLLHLLNERHVKTLIPIVPSGGSQALVSIVLNHWTDGKRHSNHLTVSVVFLGKRRPARHGEAPHS